MPSVFVFKPVIPGKYNTTKIKNAIVNALRDEGKDSLLLVRETISTWSDPPGLGYTIKESGPDLIMDAGPLPKGSHQAKKWFWLAYGTRVRYARLSRDWKSKTAPGSIKSGTGRGRVVARGHRAGAHEGIKARGWVPIIEKMRAKPFQRRMQRTVELALRS